MPESGNPVHKPLVDEETGKPITFDERFPAYFREFWGQPLTSDEQDFSWAWARLSYLEMARQGAEKWNLWLRSDLSRWTAKEERENDVLVRLKHEGDDGWGELQFHPALGRQDRYNINDIDFSNFIFPTRVDFSGAIFVNDANFIDAIFCADVSFNGVQFNNSTNFDGASFGGAACFDSAKFQLNADFTGAVFKKTANFRSCNARNAVCFKDATFSEATDFKASSFETSTDFCSTKFCGNVIFIRTKLRGHALFKGSRFLAASDFQHAEFGKEADFGGAHFKGNASFMTAHFGGAAVFSSAKFRGSADFRVSGFTAIQFTAAEFSARADFHGISILGKADFEGVKFRGPVDFGATVFISHAMFKQSLFGASAIFSNAQFQADCNFAASVFVADANFSAVQFARTSTFQESVFLSAANFHSAKFSAYADFDHVWFGKPADGGADRLFGSPAQRPNRYSKWDKRTQAAFDGLSVGASAMTVPDFRGAQFNPPPNLGYTKAPAPRLSVPAQMKDRIRRFWGFLKDDERIADKDASAKYRRLQELASAGHHQLVEKQLFREELLARRGHETKSWTEVAMINLFELVGRCGLSFWRPFTCWLVSFIAFAALYGLGTPYFGRWGLWRDMGHLFNYTLANSLPLIGVFKGSDTVAAQALYTEAIGIPFWTGVAAGFHNLLSSIFLFFALLAIRNYFKLG